MVANKKVLVTGGAGYIGSHTCLALANAGFEPIIYDNLSTGHSDLAQNFKLIIGDLNDGNRLKDVFKKNNIQCIFHFAASAYVGESIENPRLYYNNNLSNTINLLNICIDNNVNNFVFSSTCATYGIPGSNIINENSIQAPINPYGKTKLAIEWLLKDYERAYQIKPMILRYFNAAGAQENGKIGERHNPETHLIPLIFDAITLKKDSITIFGDDYSTHDGTCIRDYIHVSDLAQAHVLVFQELLNDGKPDIFNVGIGKGYSVLDVINSATKISGKNPKINYGSRRMGDPPRLVCDSSKIKSELGWKPMFGDIDQIIKTAWLWYLKDK